MKNCNKYREAEFIFQPNFFSDVFDNFSTRCCTVGFEIFDVPAGKRNRQNHVLFTLGCLAKVRSHYTVTIYGHTIRSHYTVTLYGHTIRSHYTVTLYGHTIRSHYTVTLYGHTIRSHYTVTLYGHTIRSHYTVTLYGHTIRSHYTVTLYGHTIRSHYTVTLYGHTIRSHYKGEAAANSYRIVNNWGVYNFYFQVIRRVEPSAIHQRSS